MRDAYNSPDPPSKRDQSSGEKLGSSVNGSEQIAVCCWRCQAGESLMSSLRLNFGRRLENREVWVQL